MKFGKYLQRHQVSEWRKKYVYYKQFKKQIKAIKRTLQEPTIINITYEGHHSNNININNNQDLDTKSTVRKLKNLIHKNNNEIELQQQSSNNNNGNKLLDPEEDQLGQEDQNNGSGSGTVSQEEEQQLKNSDKREEHKFDSMLKEEFEKVNSFYILQEKEFIQQFNSIKEKVLQLPLYESQIAAYKNRKSKKFKKQQLRSSQSPLPGGLNHSEDGNIPSPTSLFHHHQSIVKKRITSVSLPNNILNQTSNINNNNNTANGGSSKDGSGANPNATAAQQAIVHASNAETNWPRLKFTKIRRSLKRALEENYREIQVLKEYVTLNYTGFRKIFKKYDKVLKRKKSEEYMSMTSELYFYQSKKLDSIEHEIEQLYTDVYKHGNRRDAMSKLRVPKDYHAPPRIVFTTGLLAGMTFVLFIFCIRYMIGNVSIFYFQSDYPVDFLSMFIFFRCFALPLASGLSFLWGLSFFLYIYLSLHISGYTPIVFPFVFLVSILSILFCPFDIFFRQSRFWLINTFARIFRAPFLPVKFKDFFFGDQFTSLSIVLSDFEYVFCYFVHDLWYHTDTCWRLNPFFRPILTSIPHLLRALQSIRRYRDTKQNIHMLNCGKYSLNILSITMSAVAHSGYLTEKTTARTAMIILWILTASISTFYSCSWDFLMDWGLLRTHSRNFLLRDQLVYQHKGVYYWAIISNIIMRVSWAVNISFESYSSRTKELIVLITSVIEITRRFQWNFFRLENEHISNCGKFKAFDLRIPETYPVQVPQELNGSTKVSTAMEEGNPENEKLQPQIEEVDEDNQ
eukprot:gene4829-6018_t